MPFYDFHCKEHGVVELIQPMRNASSRLPCPSCGKMMNKVWHMPGINGSLPTLTPKMGKTRWELFENMEKEGIQGKGTVEKDKEDYEMQKKRVMDYSDKRIK